MIDEREFGALQERVARLESIRSKLLDAIPLAVAIGALLAVLGTSLQVEHRLTLVEVKLDAVLRKLTP